MPSSKPSQYRLTPQAVADLEAIWLYTAETWSVRQADLYTDSFAQSFETLLTMPEIARERAEFTPPVRIHPSGQHHIVYRIEADHILIIRILGGGQDWDALLRALDP
ncbi:plasmid stabilization protein ParE [Zhengella mangrovi]|uniref:Toxin n=1 Tax=Zhengella mangrovi TaxID=1982044 RepID=A0A2G1QHG3_9HYPH|nr:type II toxin-antitoxin system RelE/ParE family toxin [Zhengella mangrovi]PHP64956.1 plasmid stabilization protein ParE [Zhengella mangrovi]